MDGHHIRLFLQPCCLSASWGCIQSRHGDASNHKLKWSLFTPVASFNACPLPPCTASLPYLAS